MATQLDKIKKKGVEVSFEFDNDTGFTLVDNSKKVFELPLWCPNWAYNFIEAEKEFESVEREEYLDSLCCTLCCSEDCTKCTCCGAGDHCQYAKCICCGARRHCNATDCRNCCHEVTDQIFRSNPCYNLHYLAHAIIRLPMFYVTLCLVFLNAIFFRVSRDAWLWGVNSVEAAQSCRCEKIFNYILIPVANVFYLIPAATAGMLVYTIDVVVNELVFRPLVCAGLSLDIAFRNGDMVEPLVPNAGFRQWVEKVYKDWAKSADIMVNDRGKIEAASKLRDPIIEPKQLLAAFSILPPHVTQVNGAEVAAPFFIELVILVIVFDFLYRPINCPDDPDDLCDEDENKVKELTNVRLLAAFGAFLYYLNKSAESAAKFATVVKGHTNNVFLLLDLIANVVFPYLIIPLAVQIVLNSEALDIVLNLLALEFVSLIDEELFDESVKSRCKGPYCFVFKIREVPKRRFLRLVKGETETVMVVDVWSKQGIVEELDGDEKRETQYWIRDKDLSQFQAKLKPNSETVREIMRLKEMRNTKYTWNHCESIDVAPPGSPVTIGTREKKLVIPRKPDLMHIYLSEIPSGVSEHDLEAAINTHPILKALGQCRANRPTYSGSVRGGGRGSDAVILTGTASVFVEFPDLVPYTIAQYDNRDSIKGLTLKDVEVKVSPLVAVAEGSLDLPNIRNLFGSVLRSNYHEEHKDDAERAHVKLLGDIDDDADSRVLVCYDFPFADEGGHDLQSLKKDSKSKSKANSTRKRGSKGWLLGSIAIVEGQLYRRKSSVASSSVASSQQQQPHQPHEHVVAELVRSKWSRRDPRLRSSMDRKYGPTSRRLGGEQLSTLSRMARGEGVTIEEAKWEVKQDMKRDEVKTEDDGREEHASETI